jgi:hypothetical protein
MKPPAAAKQPVAAKKNATSPAMAPASK